MVRRSEDTRAVTPVVGAVLLVGVLVALGAVGGYVILGLADAGDPVPVVSLELRDSDDRAAYELVHEHGDTLDGDDLKLRGTANPESPAGTTVAAGDELSFYPTSETVSVVWYGESDTSHVLTTVEIEDPLPAPDEGCEWVDAETNGGADSITISGIVVNCDVRTDEQVTVTNGGIVFGDAVSDLKDFDGDGATVYGDVDVEAVANLQDGTITGDTVSRTADVKLGNASVDGSVIAETVAELTDGSVVEGDLQSRTKDAKVLNSTVEGSVTADGTVKLDGASVEGNVYVDPSDLDCTNSTINGEDCGSYSPRDPSEW